MSNLPVRLVSKDASVSVGLQHNMVVVEFAGFPTVRIMKDGDGEYLIAEASDVYTEIAYTLGD